MKSPVTLIDKETFGPWAVVTGASSGIGKEFARQLAASGVNVVLVARRLEMLEEVGRGVAAQFGSPPRQTWQACPRRTGLDDDPKQ